MMKEIHQAMNSFEEQFIKVHGLCVKEALILCNLEGEKLSATEISNKTGLTNSNASKIIKSIEEKGFIKRALGEIDKRQMYFSLSKSGKEKIELIRNTEIKVPIVFEPILKKCTTKK